MLEYLLIWLFTCLPNFIVCSIRTHNSILSLLLFADPSSEFAFDCLVGVYGRLETAINFPKGIDDRFRSELKKHHNLHVAAGQADMKGKLFRVNHMGYTDVYEALAVVAGTEHTLRSMGHDVDLGAGVAAAQQAIGELF